MTVESTLRISPADIVPGDRRPLEAVVDEFFSSSVETLSRAQSRLGLMSTNVSRDGKNFRKPQAVANFREWVEELEDLNQDIQFKIITLSGPKEIAGLFDDRLQKLQEQQLEVAKWPGVKVGTPIRGQKQERAFLKQRQEFIRFSRNYILEAFSAQNV